MKKMLIVLLVSFLNIIPITSMADINCKCGKVTLLGIEGNDCKVLNKLEIKVIKSGGARGTHKCILSNMQKLDCEPPEKKLNLPYTLENCHSDFRIEQ